MSTSLTGLSSNADLNHLLVPLSLPDTQLKHFPSKKCFRTLWSYFQSHWCLTLTTWKALKWPLEQPLHFTIGKTDLARFTIICSAWLEDFSRRGSIYLFIFWIGHSFSVLINRTAVAELLQHCYYLQQTYARSTHLLKVWLIFKYITQFSKVAVLNQY